jgi:hypothetical protein
MPAHVHPEPEVTAIITSETSTHMVLERKEPPQDLLIHFDNFREVH